MKNAVSFALRIVTAIAIAAAVAFAQYWIWQQLNRSTEFIGTNQSIKGFAYNGFQRDQSPLKGTYPSRAELAADLDLLGRYSDGLRTYGVTDMPELLELAGERDLLVTAGAWIDARPDASAREVAALMTGVRNRVDAFVAWGSDYFTSHRGPQVLDRADAAQIDWQDDSAVEAVAAP